MSDAARAWPDVAPGRRVVPWLLEEQAARLGDTPFVVHGGEVRSFSGMRDRASALAGAFTGVGIGVGDRVGVMAENRLELLDAFLACAWLGAILVPINTGSRGPQLQHVVGNAGLRALATESAFLPALDDVGTLPSELERVWLLDEDGPDAWRGLPAEPFPHEGDT